MKRLHIFALLLSFTTLLHAQDARSRYTSSSVLASGKWVKIYVTNAGVYQMTKSNLKSMGFSNPDKVRLYGLNLEVLPETSIENIDDDLIEIPLYHTGDKVLFYGRGSTSWTLSSASNTASLFTHFNSPYSTRTYYFLTESDSVEPKSFDKYAYSVPETAPIQTTFPEHQLIEKDAFSFLNAGRMFFDSYDFANGNSQSYSLNLPGIAPSTNVRLSVQFGAAGKKSSSLSIIFNDSTCGTLSYGALGDYEYAKVASRTFTLSAPSHESSTVKLVHTRESGITGHLDYIRASYVRQLSLTSNELLFRPNVSGSVKFQMTGGNAATVFWHINDVKNIEEVEGTFDSSTNTWTIPFTSANTTASSNWKNEELLALNPSASFPTPTLVGKVENQNLHALRDVDFVIVVPNSGKITQQAQRLADIHTQVDSMKCVVVTANQVYNEFSSGKPDATAIRRLMKMLYDTASSTATRPKNLLLFGDCVWDNRLVTPGLNKLNVDDLLLSYESENSYSHTNSYILEEYFALLDDNSTSNVLREFPRIGVGRIPATTTSEAKAVVDKLITYIKNEQVGAWKNTICVMCDDGNENKHMEDGEALIRQTSTLYPDYRIKRIYWDTYARERSSTGNSYPAVKADIDKQMTDGALIMNYSGHGAAYCLSHEQVVLRSDFENWSSPRLPLWITAACDISPIDMNEENIGETAIMNPKGACMGILTAARTVYQSSNREMNLAFMKHVLETNRDGRVYTIGQALSQAKCDLIIANSSSTNKAHFVYLGDPAMRLAVPTYKVAIDKINDVSLSGNSVPSVSAGSKVKVEGHIEDEDGNVATNYKGKVYPTIFDNIELVTCLNNPLGESNGNESEIPFTFYDRIRMLYNSVDSISAGHFSFTFPIPLDNNYSGENGLISLYASNEQQTIEANGRSTQFLISGTSPTLSTDTIGPDITIYLNSTSFTNGSTVNETPLLIATLHDEDGINVTGSGVGHDITAMIDNEEGLTYSLNSYFVPTIGDYRKGTISFSIPELEEGHHTLTLRAYDVLNNPSQKTIDFYVNQGAQPTIFNFIIDTSSLGNVVFTVINDRPESTIGLSLRIYDIAGRLVYQTEEEGHSSSGTYSFKWNYNETGSSLTSGVYVAKVGISSNSGNEATKAKKFLILQKKQ